MKKDKLVEVITFRLTAKEYAPYREIVKKTKKNKSKIMRDIFISKSDSIIVPADNSKTIKRLLFLANKTSNNTNQIAKKLNAAYKGGVVSESVYIATLNNLISIERSIGKAIDKC